MKIDWEIAEETDRGTVYQGQIGPKYWIRKYPTADGSYMCKWGRIGSTLSHYEPTLHDAKAACQADADKEANNA